MPPKPPQLPIHLIPGALQSAEVADGTTLFGLDATQSDLSYCLAAGVLFEGSRLHKTSFLKCKFEGADFRDIEILNSDFSNSNWNGLSAHRLLAKDCRMTGFASPESTWREVVFRNCRMDLASFRFCKMESVLFSECDMRVFDAFGSTMKDVSFEYCKLQDATFERCTMEGVDLRSSEVVGLRSVNGLSGAILDSGQMIELAPRMAMELGIFVIDRNPT